MKRFWVSISLFVLLLTSAEPVCALPLVVEKVAANKDFFAGFTWYLECDLYDVSRIDAERVGLILLSPLGFEVRLVWDAKAGEIYKDLLVPEKGKREAMRRESMPVADAVKLAASLKEHERKKLRR